MTYVPNALRQLVYATDANWASDHYLTEAQPSRAYRRAATAASGQIVAHT